MARKFLTPIDLSKLELQNAAIQNLATAPASPVGGQVYYDTALNALRVYANGAWVSLGAGGAGDPTMGGDLSGLASNAQIVAGAIVNADISGSAAIALTKLATDPLARANHTGTQLAATVSDFSTAVRTNRIDQLAAAGADVALGGFKITGLATPTAVGDATTKAYVDGVAAGLSWKPSARVRSTANVTLATPGATIDGVTMVANDRVLLTGQSAPAENGIWVWTGAAAALTRATDADTAAELSGAAVFVREGTGADTGWTMTTDVAITVGTTALAFTQFTGLGTVVAGAGLTKTGDTMDVGQGTGITVAADTVAIDTSVVTRKVSGNCAAALTTTITHSLNTRDVQVQVYRVASPYDTVEVDIERTDVNNVLVRFAVAPAASEYRIVVQG